MGTIGFSYNPKGIFPKLIRFFTNSKFSHTFIVTLPYFNDACIQEASSSVTTKVLSYYRTSGEKYELWELNNLSEDTNFQALKKCFQEFEGTQYGYFQLIWFSYKWLCSKFGKDISKQNNWFTSGMICSELTYWYLYYLGSPYKELLSDFNPDTIQAQDIYNIILKNPHLFSLKESNF